MTVYNIPGVFAEHLNYMGVGILLSIHLQHMAAGLSSTHFNYTRQKQCKSAMQITKKYYSLL